MRSVDFYKKRGFVAKVSELSGQSAVWVAENKKCGST
jgi:hypothetical protein